METNLPENTDSVITKVCKTCLVTKPLKAFRWKNSKNCTFCERKQCRENNKEKINQKDKQYYVNNKEKIKEKRKQYYVNNKEKRKQYRENNKEKRKQYRENNKEKIKQYYVNNKEKINQIAKQYRENNKEKINQKAKQYYVNNKEKIKEKRKQYKSTLPMPIIARNRRIPIEILKANPDFYEALKLHTLTKQEIKNKEKAL